MFVALRPIDPNEGIWDCITTFCPTRADYGKRNEMTKPSRRETKEIARAWQRGKPADIEMKRPSSGVLSIRVPEQLMRPWTSERGNEASRQELWLAS